MIKIIITTILNTFFVLSTTLIFLNVFSIALPKIHLDVEIKNKVLPIYIGNNSLNIDTRYPIQVETKIENGIYPIQIEAKSSYPAFKIQVQ